MAVATPVVIGGTSGIGRHLAEQSAQRADTVMIGGRNGARAAPVAQEINGPRVRGIEIDLAARSQIAPALESVSDMDNPILTALEQAPITLEHPDVDAAIRVTTVKLVGYAQAAHTLAPKMTPTGSIVPFGGLAQDRPYDGSTIVTTVNAGIRGLIPTLAREIAPRRINATHPEVVGDSPKWRAPPDHPAIGRTPIARLARMAEVAHAITLPLENIGANAINLPLDGGWLSTQPPCTRTSEGCWRPPLP